MSNFIEGTISGIDENKAKYIALLDSEKNIIELKEISKPPEDFIIVERKNQSLKINYEENKNGK